MPFKHPMKKHLLILILTAFSVVAFAQKDTSERIVPDTNDQAEIYSFVESTPEYPGGYEKMMIFLAENLQYPSEIKEAGISGKVIVQFVVTEKGKLEDIKITKDPCEGCGEEVIRVIKMMPDWKPGYQNGKPVNVRFNLPININFQ